MTNNMAKLRLYCFVEAVNFSVDEIQNMLKMQG